MTSVDCRDSFLIGVDVGTAGVRAALVDAGGRVKAVSTRPIRIWSPTPDYFQQSSEEIWDSCCQVIREVAGGVSPETVKGIGFDATCSLVVVDADSKPVSVSPKGEPEQNVVMWMDHRACDEADFVNATGDPMLAYAGGKISPEMQVGKLLWLKKNLDGRCWRSADRYFDLPDFLTWKATGSDSRSLCSVVCKWLYEVSADGVKRWNRDFYERIGLGELLDDNARRIGSVVKCPGEPCGDGLCREAAQRLGLLEGTPVATSIIDAHAGAIGLIGCTAPGISSSLTTKLCLICGTSTCHMCVGDTGVRVDGVWGPYWGAMLADTWLTEGGQSASGRLVDHVVDSHPAAASIKSRLAPGARVADYLNRLLDQMSLARRVPLDLLTRDVHVWPDFHGNRSPIADPTLKGMISGLTLATDEENLALLYLATLQALAYGTRHIIEVLSDRGGRRFECILATGGLSKNATFVRTQSNAISKPVLIPREAECVLLGSAILGAAAADIYPDVRSAVAAMAPQADYVHPDQTVERYHDLKYAVFKRMLDDQISYRRIMSEK